MLGICLLAEQLTASQEGPCTNDSEALALSAFSVLTLKMEAPDSSETLTTIYQTAKSHILDDSTVLMERPFGWWIRISENFYLHITTQKSVKIVNSPGGTENIHTTSRHLHWQTTDYTSLLCNEPCHNVAQLRYKQTS
jgi:hypothetical protein